MKEGWSIKQVKDICDKASSNIAQKDLGTHNGDYPIYGASGFIKNVDFYHQDKPYVGIVKDGSGVGRVNLYPAQSSLLGTLQYIIPKKGYELRFVSYALQSLNLSKYSVGAAIPHIYFRDYGEHEIAVPNLSEQQRIVGILDAVFEKIDALKANAEKNLENAKALFKQVLAKELEPKEGWEEKKLGEVCDTSAGGTPLKTSKEYYEGGNIPWIRSGEVCKKHITESEMFITEAGLSNSSAKLFPPHTVLVAMYGATAGQVGILDFESSTNQAVCGILPNDQYLPDYLYYYLLSYKDRLVATAVGNAQPNISQQKIKAIPLPLINIKTQQEIINTIERLDAKCRHLEEVAQKTIAECDALKQSILRQAFIGEL